MPPTGIQAPRTTSRGAPWLAIVAVLIPACAVEVGGIEGTRAPIIGGTTEPGEPAVVYLQIETARGRATCTGSLVAPRVVLTAKHCVCDETRNALVDGDAVTLGIGPDSESLLGYERVIEARSTEGSCSRIDQRDIAVLILERAGELDPYPVPTRAPTEGDVLTAIGYGVREAGYSPGTAPRSLSGRKERTTATVLQVTETELTISGPTSCYGDSGGPGFIDGAVAGVVSRGAGYCSGVVIYTRTDAFPDLVTAAIEETGGSPGATVAPAERDPDESGGGWREPAPTPVGGASAAPREGEGAGLGAPDGREPLGLNGGCSATGARGARLLFSVVLLVLFLSLRVRGPLRSGLFIVGLMLLPAVARAQGTAVLEFTGAGAGRARAQTVTALSPIAELIPAARIYQTARETGIDTGRAATREGVAILVRGVSRGERIRLTLKTPEGRILASAAPRRPTTRRARRAYVATTRALFRVGARHLSDPPRRRAVEDERPPAFRTAAGGEDVGDEDADVDDEDYDEDDDEERDEEDGEERFDEPASGEDLPPLLVVHGGLAGRTRDSDVALRSGGRRRFRSGLFPAIAAQAELRPFMGEGPAAVGVIMVLEGSHSIGLTSLDDNDVALETTAFQVEAGIGYLLELSGTEVGLRASLGHDTFSLATGSTLFPSAAYTYGRAGLELRVPIMDEALRFDVTAAARFLLSVGPLVPFFGEVASASGFDASLTLGGIAEMGLSYGARVSFSRYGLTFSGDGANADDAASEGVDLSFTATLLLGFVVDK